MRKLIYTLILLTFTIFSCKAQETLETVDSVDLLRYSGKWYEICHMPARFLDGCDCITATYSPELDYVRVLNQCRKSDGTWSSIAGKAFPVKGSRNSKLKVQFFWPFRGNYYIMYLSDDYSWAIVGEPSRKYLWILSRTPEMQPLLYKSLVQKCADAGYNVGSLVVCNHKECSK